MWVTSELVEMSVCVKCRLDDLCLLYVRLGVDHMAAVVARALLSSSATGLPFSPSPSASVCPRDFFAGGCLSSVSSLPRVESRALVSVSARRFATPDVAAVLVESLADDGEGATASDAEAATPEVAAWIEAAVLMACEFAVSGWCCMVSASPLACLLVSSRACASNACRWSRNWRVTSGCSPSSGFGSDISC